MPLFTVLSPNLPSLLRSIFMDLRRRMWLLLQLPSCQPPAAHATHNHSSSLHLSFNESHSWYQGVFKPLYGVAESRTGHWESDTSERLHFHFSLSCIGEGNGNSLQCSCLENPRDGGAWWAAVYGVAQSRTRLKWLSSSSTSGSKQS